MSLRLSFIGMSNIGKTRWARRMAGMGYEHLDCDRLIGKKLTPVLNGKTDTDGLADWMGMPFAEQYKQNSAAYLNAEQQVMRECLALLGKDAKTPYVVDTTGSVIYMPHEILRDLRARTRVIYFEASEAHIDALYKRYIKHPKPTIWGDLYMQQAGESGMQALKRCYPDLLKYRAAIYRKLAHVIIPYEKHRAADADIAALIRVPE